MKYSSDAVDHHVVALLLQRFVEFLGDLIAPEAVQIFAFRVFQLDAHLQPVRHHQIERAQHAIQTGQHTQMLLGKVEIGLVEILRLQAGVNVALERQQRLTGIVWGKFRLPLAKARGVQPGQLVADAHQAGDLRRRQLAANFDKPLRLVQQFGLREAFCRQRAVVIESFAGK